MRWVKRGAADRPTSPGPRSARTTLSALKGGEGISYSAAAAVSKVRILPAVFEW